MILIASPNQFHHENPKIISTLLWNSGSGGGGDISLSFYDSKHDEEYASPGKKKKRAKTWNLNKQP